MKAKKVFAAVMLVALLTVLAAGAAFARGHGRHGGGYMHGGYGGGYMHEGWGPRGGYCDGWGRDMGGPRGGRYGYGHGGRYYDNNAYTGSMPKEILDKLAEAQKIAIDLRIELDKTPVNRERALELNRQHRSLMQEVSDWHFQQRLDNYTGN